MEELIEVHSVRSGVGVEFEYGLERYLGAGPHRLELAVEQQVGHVLESLLARPSVVRITG